MSIEKPQVLIVDDEPQMLLAMEAVLKRLSVNVVKSSSGPEALETLKKTKADLIISDMKMPEMTGLELLAKIRESDQSTPVVMITAYGTINQAVDAMKNGAFDFITKPFSAEDLERTIERVFRPQRNGAQASATRSNLTENKAGIAIVTNDPGFRSVLEIASTIAQSNASVLIQGESGTGKELVAQLIHQSSRRSSGPFVAVNCAALPGNLLESELFGHEKGAFTGAIGQKIGKFELANGGTILLDEISEMEPVLQAKLLRVLQEREVDRVGGSKPTPIDVRVVATTNRDIRESVKRGEFREDLYYRLNVVPIFMPALRARRGDVRLLTEHFVRKFSGGEIRKLSNELLDSLSQYSWPGNVRELQNACERAVLLGMGGELRAEHFLLGSITPDPETSGGSDDQLILQPGLSVAEAEKRLILETLKSTGNNRTRAAELLGISIRTLRNKLHEYGVERE